MADYFENKYFGDDLVVKGSYFQFQDTDGIIKNYPILGLIELIDMKVVKMKTETGKIIIRNIMTDQTQFRNRIKKLLDENNFNYRYKSFVNSKHKSNSFFEIFYKKDDRSTIIIKITLGKLSIINIAVIKNGNDKIHILYEFDMENNSYARNNEKIIELDNRLTYIKMCY